jgi:hypothetical protein
MPDCDDVGIRSRRSNGRLDGAATANLHKQSICFKLASTYHAALDSRRGFGLRGVTYFRKEARTVTLPTVLPDWALADSTGLGRATNGRSRIVPRLASSQKLKGLNEVGSAAKVARGHGDFEVRF